MAIDGHGTAATGDGDGDGDQPMIGIFDSGLGGLSVLAAIAQALPQADLLYFADTAHVPYGDKSEAFIRERVLVIGKHLVAQGCGLIVVACNTAHGSGRGRFSRTASRAAGGWRRARRQTRGSGVAQWPHRGSGNAIDDAQPASRQPHPATCRRRAGGRRRLRWLGQPASKTCASMTPISLAKHASISRRYSPPVSTRSF
jgi:hypothetical protein